MTNLWVIPTDLGTSFSDSEYADDACQMASNILWAMSGRKYSGIVTVSERYITSIDSFRYAGASAKNFSPQLASGQVYNVPSEDFNDSAYQSDGTSSISRIRLRGKPVQEIHLVRSMYNGLIIDPDTYYIAEHSTLVAYKGTPWPPGNLEVTYTFGIRAPTAGRQAARLFAIELVKLWEGDDCALPDRVTSVSRQGVSYTILDNQDFLENMRTGIYAIDLFIKTANPAKALAPPKIFSPDIPRPRRAAPARPMVYAASATFDASLTIINNFNATQTHTISGALAGLAAYNNANYTLRLDASSWNGYMIKSYPANAADFRVVGGTTFLDLDFTYETTYEAVGPNDPGTWALYAVDASGATTELLEGNLQIKKVIASQINPTPNGSGPTNLTCQEGATFNKTITWSIDGTAVNLAGFSAAMQVRSSFLIDSAVLTLVSTAGAAKIITAGVVTNNVATITTSTAHGYTSGNTVTLFNLTASSGNSEHIVLTTPTATSFTVAYISGNSSLTLGANPTATLTAGITLGGSAGTIVINITAAQTTALTAGNYVYDLELTSGGGFVTRILEGKFVITPEVTQI